jgi:hypothetical protein
MNNTSWGNKARKNQAVSTAFLERWERAAAKRRRRLEEIFAANPVNGKRAAELQAWQRNLGAKRAWLQARLDHIAEIEKLLENALKDCH